MPDQSLLDAGRRRLAPGRLVVASHNAGKVREIRALLEPYGVEPVSAVELGLPEPDETETTYTGNARLKAHAAAVASGLPALADDSGIGVALLDWAPGIHSARFAERPGTGRDFDWGMARLWQEIDAKAPGSEAPKASFFCALSLAWPDGHDETFLGRVDGTLVRSPRGDRGFGYDPIFVPDGYTETFGEMDPDAKHAMSHRADAFAKLVAACLVPVD
ncbi:MAG: non-canonical purine NTP pyrophosphatase [Pseudomonadota bacterium]